MSGGTVYRGGRYADEDPTAVLPVVPGAAGVIGYEANPTVVLPPVPPGPAAPSGPPVAAPPPAPRAAPAETLAAPDITGSLRTAALGAALGAAAVSDDYNLANTLPAMVYELLLGGVLAGVIVPLLMRARTTDADRGEAYAQRLLTAAAVFLGAATALAVAAAPLLTRIMTNA